MDVNADVAFIGKILTIVVIDLILSGDNAVVIGLAARRLSDENRRKAIIVGGAGAVALRILFTILASFLLDIPLLQAGGALLLLWIAWKLLRPHVESAHVREADTLTTAIKTIILADVVMSLDNILAVGGASEGHVGLLVFGLLLSIPLLLLGSEMIARLLGRYPALVYGGVIVLILTAVRMFFHDDKVHERYAATTPVILAITAAISAAMILGSMRIARTMGLDAGVAAEVLAAEFAAMPDVDLFEDETRPTPPEAPDVAAPAEEDQSHGR